MFDVNVLNIILTWSNIANMFNEIYLMNLLSNIFIKFVVYKI